MTYKPAMGRFVALLFLVLACRAFPATYQVPADEPMATIVIPDEWKTKAHGEFLEATSPDGALNFLVKPAEPRKPAESIGEAMRYLRNQSGITVQADSRKDEPGKLNDMEVRNISWQGKNKAGDVQIRFTLVTIGKDETLIAVCWGSPDAERKFRVELDKIRLSIRRAPRAEDSPERK